jgi:DNA-binding response OmpR family regulator
MAVAARRAVVLEDDRGVRQLLELVLSTEGWASDGGSSVDEVAGKLAGAGLVILDHHLPGMTGLEVLAALRDLGVDVPVVMLTGDPSARGRAELLGVDRFLLKPFDLTELLDVLRLLDRRGDQREVDLRDHDEVAGEPAPDSGRPWFASR